MSGDLECARQLVEEFEILRREIEDIDTRFMYRVAKKDHLKSMQEIRQSVDEALQRLKRTRYISTNKRNRESHGSSEWIGDGPDKKAELM
jgi:hypothetical protein